MAVFYENSVMRESRRTASRLALVLCGALTWGCEAPADVDLSGGESNGQTATAGADDDAEATQAGAGPQTPGQDAEPGSDPRTPTSAQAGSDDSGVDMDTDNNDGGAPNEPDPADPDPNTGDAGVGVQQVDSGPAQPADPCATDNGGCDSLTTCTSSDEVVTCGACPDGYTGTGEDGCVDVDECASDNGGCDALTACTNTDGSHTCGACPDGYSGTGEDGCVDVDECATDNGGCDALTACTNTDGSRSCGACPAGYTGNGEDGCVDVDECAADESPCSTPSLCTNIPGGYECGPCGAGFTGNGDEGCFDIDECSASEGPCDALVTCTNNFGGFECGACPAGYGGSGAEGCVDIDECEVDNGGCDQTCTNSPGGYECSCDEDYVLQPNAHTCLPQLEQSPLFSPSFTRVAECAVAMADGGLGVAAWLDDTALKVSRFDASTMPGVTTGFAAAETVVPSGVSQLAAVRAPNGDVMVAYVTNNASATLYTVRWDATNGWGTATSVLTSAQGIPRLAVDGAGNYFLVTLQMTNSRMRIAATRHTGLAWGTVSYLDNDFHGWPHNPVLRVNQSGDAVVAWAQPFFMENINHPWANVFRGGSWQGYVEVEAGNVVTVNTPDAGIDENGEVTVVWAPNTLPGSIGVRRMTSSGWGSIDYLSIGDEALYERVAVSGNGDAVALWREGTDGLYQSTYTPGDGWGARTVAETGHYGAPALAAGGNGGFLWGTNPAGSVEAMFARRHGDGKWTPVGYAGGDPYIVTGVRVAMAPDGDGIACWRGKPLAGGYNYSVYAQHFPGPGPATQRD